MKYDHKWLMAALAVAGGLMIANSVQAQFVLGNGASAGVAMAGGSFSSPNTTDANGLALTGTGYNWGQWNIPAQSYGPGADKIIFNYTLTGPAPGTTGPDYANGAAWTWYSLQPLIDTYAPGNLSDNLTRYFGYDGYNLSYGFPSGQGIANQDVGYVYNPANQEVTITAALSAANKADLAAGGTVTFFQLSMDPTSTLPDGYGFRINYIELVPEPAVAALVGLGLAGLALARRRVSAK